MAVGLCWQALGEGDSALESYHACVDMSEQMPWFRTWTGARMAMVALGQGDLDSAARYVDEALSVGRGISLYEARAAQCEVAVRRGDEMAQALIASALEQARTGGHVVSARRLEELSALAPS
jgi:hypothetical protein